jgi:PAS domain S-box-containing protein
MEDASFRCEVDFHAIVEQMADLVFVTDGEGRIVYISPSVLAMLGYSPEEVTGRHLTAFLPQEVIGPVTARFTQTIRQGTPVKGFPIRILRQDGGTLSAEVDASIYRNGSFLGTLGVIRDLSERNSMEEALQENERENALKAELLRKAPVIAAFHDKDLNVVWANQAYEMATGLSAQDMAGKKCYSVWNLAKACSNCPVVKAIETGEPYEAELTPQNQDHWPESQGYWLSRATPVRDADGSILGAIEIAIDITEQKQAERALRDSEEKYRSLVETAIEGVASIDLNGNLTFINDALCLMMGYSQDELLNKPFAGILHPDDLPALMEAFLTAVAGTRTGATIEFRAIQKTGQSIWLSTQPTAIVIDGKAIGFNAILHNISMLKREEEALNKSTQLLSDTGEMAKVGGWELDLSTKEVSWTEEVCRIHGVKPGYRPKLEETLNFYAPESRPALDEALKKAAETGKPYDLESLFIPSGSKDRIWVRSLGRAVYSDGKITKLAGTFQNIDKYKRAEEALRASEEKYRALVENANEAIIVTQDGALKFANPKASKLFGYSLEEAVGRPFVEFIHPDDRYLVAERYRKRLDGEVSTVVYPFRTIHKDGSIRWAEINSVLIAWEDRPAIMSYLSDITERKRAEEALKQGNERLLLATVAGGVGIWDLDVVNNKLTWDDQMFRLYGVAPDNFGGAYETWKERVHPEDVERGDAEVQMALRGEKEFDTEFRVVWPNGTIHHIRARARVHRDAAGQPTKLIGTNYDITERKRAEEKLRTAEANYRNLFERVPSGLYRSTLEGRFLEVNPALADLFGYSSVQELMTLDIGSAFYHSAEERRQWVEKLLQAGELRNTEFQALRKNGSSMVLLEHSRVVRDESGKVLFFEGTLTDTTDRKRAEEALRESEEKYRLLIENSHDIIYTLTPNGIITFVSPGWTVLLGHPVDQVVGRPYQQFIHPDDLERYQAFLQRTIQTGQRQTGVEYRVQHADGSWRWHTTNVVPLKDEAGKVVGYEGIASDITDRKRLEGEMEKTRADFLFGVSHELKTPLFLMNISLDMLENSPESGRAKRTSEFMETWKRNLHRLQHLVFNMVDSQRTQTMGFKIERQSTDFRALIERVVQEQELLAGPKKVRITMDLAPIPPLFIDLDAIHRLVENLLTNAIKFSPRRSEVTIRLTEEDAQAVLTVKDQGPGISAEEQEGLFLPFQRAAAAVRSVIPGTGLGLYVAKIIVDAHGGTISLRSKVGKGTTVTVRLPLGEPEDKKQKGEIIGT